MKKNIIIVIAALFAFGQGAWAQNQETLNLETDGDNNYLISSAENLKTLSAYVNAGNNCSGKKFKVTTDITFGESEFVPIGKVEYDENGTPNYDKGFKGSFDGNNKTINGLKVNKTDIEGVGLFGIVSYPGVVKNIKLSECEFIGSLCVGAIAGEYAGNGDEISEWGIYDCEVTNDVTVKAVSGEGDDALPAWYAGGIIGSANVATVKNCISSAKVSGEEYVGGIAGQMCKSDSYFGRLIDCYYTGESGNVTATTNKYVNVIVGLNGEVNDDDEFVDGSAGTLAITLFDDDSNDIKNATRLDNYSSLTCNVTVNGRTLYKDDSWNTLCLPFNVKKIGDTPLAGATVKTLSSSSFADGTLTLNFTAPSDDACDIVAGKPYIVKWDNGNPVSNPIFNGVEIGGETTDITTDYVDFKGNYSPIALTAGDKTVLYMGSSNHLYYPNASFNINAFRGYFKLKGLTAGELSTSGEVNSIVLNFGDDATSIEETSNPKSQTSYHYPWFSLDGRRINGHPTAKGVYINNG